MHILLINHYAGSLDLGMEYRPFYLAREWINAGHDVTIIAASYSHVRYKQPFVPKNITHEHIEGIHYIWLKTTVYKGNGIKRFISMLQFILKLFYYFKRIIKKIKYDIIIASSTYPLDIFPARYYAKKNKAKLVFEVHDLWPLSPIELGGISKYNPFIILMQIAENYAYKKCDCVVSLLPNAERHMINHGLKKGKFFYIPNGVTVGENQNTNNSLSNEVIKKIRAIKKKAKYTICYAGAHGIANELLYFIKAAKLCNPVDINFILIGQGPEKQRLINYASHYSINNVFFFDPIPKAQIQTFLSYMDILFISLQNQALFLWGISPNKLLDYMLASKPILSTIKASNDIVAEANCGLTIEPANEESIYLGVQKILKLSEEERSKLGKNGYDYVIKNHNYEVLAKIFLSVINK